MLGPVPVPSETVPDTFSPCVRPGLWLQNPTLVLRGLWTGNTHNLFEDTENIPACLPLFESTLVYGVML
jgi:hypothetical protein